MNEVKTKMKCSIILHSRDCISWVYTVCKVKKNAMFFENYNLAPLKLYNRLSQYRIKPDGLIHQYTKGLNSVKQITLVYPGL